MKRDKNFWIKASRDIEKIDISKISRIALHWFLAELCSHFGEDSGDGDEYKDDFIKDFLGITHENAIVIPMYNSVQSMFLMETEKKIYIIWRGTQNLKALLYDLKIFPLIDGYKHNGIWKIFLMFKDEIEKYIRDSFGVPKSDFSNVKKICDISGHSLGGAETINTGWWLSKKGLDCRCTAFGSPYITIEKGVNEINELISQQKLDILRVVNGYDLVTRFDPTGLGKHPGDLINYKKSKWTKYSKIVSLLHHRYSDYTKGNIDFVLKYGDKEGAKLLKIVKNWCNI